MVDADAGRIEEDRQHEPVCRRQGQGQDQRQGHRHAVVSVVAGPVGLEAAVGGALDLAGQDKHQAKGRRGACADQRSGASGAHGGQSGSDQEGAAGLGHVEGGRRPHPPGGAPMLLGELGEAADRRGEEAGADGQLHRLRDGGQPEHDRRRGHQAGGKDQEQPQQCGEVVRQAVPLGLARPEPRHGGLEPGEDDGVDQGRDGKRQGVGAVRLRRQQPREQDDAEQAHKALHKVRRQVADHAAPEHRALPDGVPVAEQAGDGLGHDVEVQPERLALDIFDVQRHAPANRVGGVHGSA